MSGESYDEEEKINNREKEFKKNIKKNQQPKESMHALSNPQILNLSIQQMIWHLLFSYSDLL